MDANVAAIRVAKKLQPPRPRHAVFVGGHALPWQSR